MTPFEKLVAKLGKNHPDVIRLSQEVDAEDQALNRKHSAEFELCIQDENISITDSMQARADQIRMG